MCKVFRKTSDDLIDYGLIEPPFNILKNRSWDENYLPMGSNTMLGGRTIAIHGNYVAVSSKYNDSGVVYVYFDKGNGEYELKHEVTISGDFESHLPIVELSSGYLFVTDPLSTPKINVYKISNLSVVNENTPSTNIPEKVLMSENIEGGDNTIVNGFCSLHADNVANNVLVGYATGDVLV